MMGFYLRLSNLSTPQKLAIAVALPVSGLLLYFLLKNNDEEEYIPKEKIVTSRHRVIEVNVPRNAAGAIIGTGGCQIKMIQEKSGARVNFKDDNIADAIERTVVIRGSDEQAQQAEILIRKIVADIPPVIEEKIFVPRRCLGRIIGKGGETVRNISRVTKAKVIIDRDEDKTKGDMRDITIRGTATAVVNAKDMIEDLLQDEASYRAKIALSQANRHRRVDTATSKTQSHHINGVDSQSLVRLADWPENIHDYLEMYISAIADPGHFWVQLINAESPKLDTLQDIMTKYYSAQPKIHNANFKVGDMVAAPFEGEHSFYRARVLEVKAEELDIFYIDYGDSELVSISEAFQLREDFLELPAQAIECCLSDVEPIDPAKEWTEEAIILFEDLTHVAKWKVIMAKYFGTQETTFGTFRSVLLYDTNGPDDINISEELIKKGLARYKTLEPSSKVTNCLQSSDQDNCIICEIGEPGSIIKEKQNNYQQFKMEFVNRKPENKNNKKMIYERDKQHLNDNLDTSMLSPKPANSLWDTCLNLFSNFNIKPKRTDSAATFSNTNIHSVEKGNVTKFLNQKNSNEQPNQSYNAREWDEIEGIQICSFSADHQFAKNNNTGNEFDLLRRSDVLPKCSLELSCKYRELLPVDNEENSSSLNMTVELMSDNKQFNILDSSGIKSKQTIQFGCLSENYNKLKNLIAVSLEELLNAAECYNLEVIAAPVTYRVACIQDVHIRRALNIRSKQPMVYVDQVLEINNFNTESVRKSHVNDFQSNAQTNLVESLTCSNDFENRECVNIFSNDVNNYTVTAITHAVPPCDIRRCITETEKTNPNVKFDKANFRDPPHDFQKNNYGIYSEEHSNVNDISINSNGIASASKHEPLNFDLHKSREEIDIKNRTIETINYNEVINRKKSNSDENLSNNAVVVVFDNLSTKINESSQLFSHLRQEGDELTNKSIFIDQCADMLLNEYIHDEILVLLCQELDNRIIQEIYYGIALNVCGESIRDIISVVFVNEISKAIAKEMAYEVCEELLHELIAGVTLKNWDSNAQVEPLTYEIVDEFSCELIKGAIHKFADEHCNETDNNVEEISKFHFESITGDQSIIFKNDLTIGNEHILCPIPPCLERIVEFSDDSLDADVSENEEATHLSSKCDQIIKIKENKVHSFSKSQCQLDLVTSHKENNQNSVFSQPDVTICTEMFMQQDSILKTNLQHVNTNLVGEQSLSSKNDVSGERDRAHSAVVFVESGFQPTSPRSMRVKIKPPCNTSTYSNSKYGEFILDSVKSFRKEHNPYMFTHSQHANDTSDDDYDDENFVVLIEDDSQKDIEVLKKCLDDNNLDNDTDSLISDDSLDNCNNSRFPVDINDADINNRTGCIVDSSNIMETDTSPTTLSDNDIVYPSETMSMHFLNDGFVKCEATPKYTCDEYNALKYKILPDIVQCGGDIFKNSQVQTDDTCLNNTESSTLYDSLEGENIFENRLCNHNEQNILQHETKIEFEQDENDLACSTVGVSEANDLQDENDLACSTVGVSEANDLQESLNESPLMFDRIAAENEMREDEIIHADASNIKQLDDILMAKNLIRDVHFCGSNQRAMSPEIEFLSLNYHDHEDRQTSDSISDIKLNLDKYDTTVNTNDVVCLNLCDQSHEKQENPSNMTEGENNDMCFNYLETDRFQEKCVISLDISATEDLSCDMNNVSSDDSSFKKNSTNFSNLKGYVKLKKNETLNNIKFIDDSSSEDERSDTRCKKSITSNTAIDSETSNILEMEEGHVAKMGTEITAGWNWEIENECSQIDPDVCYCSFQGEKCTTALTISCKSGFEQQQYNDLESNVAKVNSCHKYDKTAFSSDDVNLGNTCVATSVSDKLGAMGTSLSPRIDIIANSATVLFTKSNTQTDESQMPLNVPPEGLQNDVAPVKGLLVRRKHSLNCPHKPPKKIVRFQKHNVEYILSPNESSSSDSEDSFSGASYTIDQQNSNINYTQNYLVLNLTHAAKATFDEDETLL